MSGDIFVYNVKISPPHQLNPEYAYLTQPLNQILIYNVHIYRKEFAEFGSYVCIQMDREIVYLLYSVTNSWCELSEPFSSHTLHIERRFVEKIMCRSELILWKVSTPTSDVCPGQRKVTYTLILRIISPVKGRFNYQGSMYGYHMGHVKNIIPASQKKTFHSKCTCPLRKWKTKTKI